MTERLSRVRSSLTYHLISSHHLLSTCLYLSRRTRVQASWLVGGPLPPCSTAGCAKKHSQPGSSSKTTSSHTWPTPLHTTVPYVSGLFQTHVRWKTISSSANMEWRSMFVQHASAPSLLPAVWVTTPRLALHLHFSPAAIARPHSRMSKSTKLIFNSPRHATMPFGTRCQRLSASTTLITTLLRLLCKDRSCIPHTQTQLPLLAALPKCPPT